MAAKYYKKNKTKKYCKEKHARTIKIFLKKKNQKASNAGKRCRKLFIENELCEEENN